jgi:hypothetical protein
MESKRQEKNRTHATEHAKVSRIAPRSGRSTDHGNRIAAGIFQYETKALAVTDLKFPVLVIPPDHSWVGRSTFRGTNTNIPGGPASEK